MASQPPAPNPLQFETHLVEEIRRGSHTTERNAQQCLIIWDRCQQILDALRDNVAALQIDDRLTAVTEFDILLLKALALIAEEAESSLPSPETRETWPTNRVGLRQVCDELHGPLFSRISTPKFDWSKKLDDAEKWDELGWRESHLVSIHSTVMDLMKTNSSAISDGMKNAALDAEDVCSQSIALWKCTKDLRERATMCIGDILEGISQTKNDPSTSSQIDWDRLSRDAHETVEAARKSVRSTHDFVGGVIGRFGHSGSSSSDTGGPVQASLPSRSRSRDTDSGASETVSLGSQSRLERSRGPVALNAPPEISARRGARPGSIRSFLSPTASSESTGHHRPSLRSIFSRKRPSETGIVDTVLLDERQGTILEAGSSTSSIAPNTSRSHALTEPLSRVLHSFTSTFAQDTDEGRERSNTHDIKRRMIPGGHNETLISDREVEATLPAQFSLGSTSTVDLSAHDSQTPSTYSPDDPATYPAIVSGSSRPASRRPLPHPPTHHRDFTPSSAISPTLPDLSELSLGATSPGLTSGHPGTGSEHGRAIRDAQSRDYQVVTRTTNASNTPMGANSRTALDSGAGSNWDFGHQDRPLSDTELPAYAPPANNSSSGQMAWGNDRKDPSIFSGPSSVRDTNQPTAAGPPREDNERFDPFPTRRHYYHALARALRHGYEPPIGTGLQGGAEHASRRPSLPANLVIRIFRAAMITEIVTAKVSLVTPQQECKSVVANGPNVAGSLIWATPTLSRDVYEKILAVRLRTLSRDQGWCSDPSRGSWSWFEIGILGPEWRERPRPGQNVNPSPKLSQNGRELRWKSHNNSIAGTRFSWHEGEEFGREHELLRHFEPNSDRLGVWMCAQYGDWSCVVKEAVVELKKRYEPTFLIDSQVAVA